MPDLIRHLCLSSKDCTGFLVLQFGGDKWSIHMMLNPPRMGDNYSTYASVSKTRYPPDRCLLVRATRPKYAYSRWQSTEAPTEPPRLLQSPVVSTSCQQLHEPPAIDPFYIPNSKAIERFREAQTYSQCLLF